MSKNLVKEVVWSKMKLYIRDTVGWMSGVVGGLQNYLNEILEHGNETDRLTKPYNVELALTIAI